MRKLRSVPFDWARPAALGEVLSQSAGEIAGLSSEGGLFDYASDGEIAAILSHISARVPAGTFFVGSTSRGDGDAGFLNEAGGAAVQLRSPQDISALAQRTGWRVERTEDSPLSRELLLWSTGGP